MNEFFIKANHKLYVPGQEKNQSQQGNSRKIWEDSYVFRTINISKLLGEGLMGEAFGDLFLVGDNEDDVSLKKRDERIEISCPMFLRPIMKQILSVGKSIKIIRYLETNELLYSKNKQEEAIQIENINFQ